MDVCEITAGYSVVFHRMTTYIIDCENQSPPADPHCLSGHW